jgi:hypothetical protein
MFVARLMASHVEGRVTKSMYLKSDGKTTTVKGEAMQFETESQLQNFLRTTAAKEGHPPEVQMEPL